MNIGPAGYKICNWSTIVPGFCGLFGGCAASAHPLAWDGLFNQTGTWAGNTFYYFINANICGFACSPDEDGTWPNLGWEHLAAMTELLTIGGVWSLWIRCLAGAQPWLGQKISPDPTSPIGTYQRMGFWPPNAPDTMIVLPATSLCCPAAADDARSVPAVWTGTPQPARVRIKNYFASVEPLLQVTSCSDPAVPGCPVWDGTMPSLVQPDPTAEFYQQDPAGFCLGEYTIKTAKVNSMVCSFQASAWWWLELNCAGGPIWNGRKYQGETAEGTYYRDATAPQPSGPECIVIESY